ncbi:XisI protein [Pseudanabaena galeata UHCC 0370]|uniref:XisI protein n=1 Tax=Pseudanabaena galeata UHCC 0370 TaxID=3110310 RepID=A0ABU5TE84_9CYAN|nr:XisI protein [Pseudanabaena galeata]MEA5475993.1 XisI protein [Pseudanabaena galeata UHCC 0370]
MEKLTQYRQIIQSILLTYTEIPYSHGELICKPIFDEIHDSYLLITLGWDRKTRVHGSLIHLDIINGKVWVQRDETEDGVTSELFAAGIPRHDIVLAFHPVDVRPYTGYATA